MVDVSKTGGGNFKYRHPVTISSSLMQTSHLPSSEVSHNALHNPLQNTFSCPRATGRMAKTRARRRPLHTFKSRKSHNFFLPFSYRHPSTISPVPNTLHHPTTQACPTGASRAALINSAKISNMLFPHTNDRTTDNLLLSHMM